MIRFISKSILLLIFLLFSPHFSSLYPSTTPIRISIPAGPTTFDPRQSRDLLTMDIVRLLFSGLTKLSHTGQVELDLASSIQPSKDGLCYQITLRQAQWSDETPVTAHDFVYTWQTMLEKERSSPSAFLLFWLKNGSKAYNAELSTKEVGVRAISDSHLEVVLEKPCPFFEQLLATPAFCAVQKEYAQSTKAFTEISSLPVSGPYRVEQWQLQTGVQLVKNPRYWTKLDYPTLSFSVVDDATALTMFNGGLFEWAGSPLGNLPTDCISSLQQEDKLLIIPAAGTYFLSVNVKDPVLSDVRVRKALSLVIDREGLVKYVLQGGQEVAHSLTPPCLLPKRHNSSYQDIEQAKTLLAAYCKEVGKSPGSLTITLSHKSLEKDARTAQALQQDIQTHLGITVHLDTSDYKHFFSKVSSKNYELAFCSWFADYFDPHGFLAVFESALNGTNNTNWESPSYQALLQQSSESVNSEKRKQRLYKLEDILAAELPIIPLFHGCFNYVQEPTVTGVRISPLGHLVVN